MKDLEKNLKDLEKTLNEIISASLWEPGGDPVDEQLSAAAKAYKQLKTSNLKVYSEDSVIRILSGDNVEEENYL